MKVFSVFPFILIMLVIILIFLTFSMRSFPKTRNSPHAMKRLQMKFEHEERLAEIDKGFIDKAKMDKF